MRHADYPFWSFIGLAAVLLPAPWHWKARNIATLSLIGWLAVSNLVLFTNTIIWADNYADLAPIWCDISGHVLVAAYQAVPACSLAQMRRLESVASTRRTVFSAKEKTRRLWIEIAICIVYPLVMLPINYIVNGHRYDILENTGCSVGFFLSWPGLAVRVFVPMAVSFASLVYAMRWFLIRRLQFRSILAKSESSLSIGRYLRLIALAVADSGILVLNAVVALVTTFSGITGLRDNPVKPYTSFQDIHFHFEQISQFPESMYTTNANIAQTIGFYVLPLYSITFFIFFGFGEEAITEYLRLSRWLSHQIRKMRGLNRVKPAPLSLTLGSKVIATEAHHSGATAGEDRDVDLKDIASPARRSGIPVLVERSVV